ncbi:MULTISPECIES: LysR family transcriptional regulator [Thalassospira]|uniref:DNA-binding transcriptional regulator, LysR family n=1 Tax=Thalassospira xiamenensis TaxID=220697 RepID=A0A285TP38_9PROT|nr:MULTISPECIES: LysR family transcriptional regulator [Thalassospira]MBO9507439.1 LysR family transcriptional regulator [Thalassospira sp. A3_1]MCH2275741.1 LysR family transcriptional regulator [Thalassospira sp.]RCK31632.1 regulatory protein [Thalassospira xiamenensis]SOC24498.1 DNA-binding transcriptional regulator, LysR family [Thalassospira xiamenensis]
MRHLQTFRLIEAVARAGSMRKAAEDMNLTASALNRRINGFEDEFGTELFERLPSGVRLNPAGELLLHHYRAMASDLERVQGQVADLSGERRGHISIACSQALLPYFLPRQIAEYRRDHPGVTFSVNIRDRAQAEQELASYSSDLALVFEPVYLVDFEVIHTIPQTVNVVMRSDHPLATKPEIRLRDCLNIPHVAPTHRFGVRHLLDFAARRNSRQMSPVIETESFELIRHYVMHENVIGFQIPIGLRTEENGILINRPISERDLPAGSLILGQMRGRTLPVASARFAMQLAHALGELSP